MSTATTDDLRKYEGPPYEFTPAQNEVVRNLGNSMNWASIPAVALGAVTLFHLILTAIWAFQTGAFRNGQVIALLVILLVTFILYMAIGRWLMTASVGFRAIAETRGQDIPFLMVSLDNLRKFFGLLAFFVKVVLIISLIGLAVSLYQAWSGGWQEFGVPKIQIPVPTNPAAK